MANIYTHTTIEPCIPNKYITDDIQTLFEEAYITAEPYEKETYLFAENGIDFDCEELVYKTLQKIFKQMIADKLKPIPFAVQTAYTCDKMRPGGFGGSAVVITDKTIKEFSTWGFINTERLRYKNRGIRK